MPAPQGAAATDAGAIDAPIAATGEAVPPGLKARAVRGSLWTGVGFGFSQAFRFFSNLALVWLLMPEIFGLMAIVNIVLVGLQMFSDVGIGPCIIQNRRGDDPAFLNTAWTIQVIRGVVLWLVACLIAWPVSRIWYEPLWYLLPAAGITAFISGFNATALFTLNRHLALGRLTLLEMTAQIVGMTVMVVWAWLSPTVWALIGGSIASVLLKMVISHRLVPGPRNRLHWDPLVVAELFRFGRWITLSTILTFLAGQVDKLLFGALLSATAMGVFWQGLQLADLLPQLSKRLGSVVGFPALAELHRNNPDRFGPRLLHLRCVLVLPINAGLLLLTALGPAFIYAIYPDKFAGAGWILQVLAVNSLCGMLNTSYGHAFLAVGATFHTMLVVAAQLVVVVPATLTGYALAGESGFILGIGISQWLLYPLFAMLASSRGFWQPRFDLPVLAGGAALAVLALLTGDLLVRTWWL